MPKATIIGGYGKMGTFFQRILSNLGYAITISSRTKKDSVHKYESNIEKATENSDLIVIATPINTTEEILRELNRILKDSSSTPLVFDITSIKSNLIEIFKEIKKSKIKYVTTHPMFGPDTSKNKWYAFLSEVSSSNALNQVEKIFNKAGIITEIIPLEKHDEYINLLLNLPHVLNHIFAKILSDSKISSKILSTMGGTTFKKQLELSAAVESEEPELYFDILNKNKNIENLFSLVEETTSQLRDIIKNNKKSDFISWMKTNRSFLENIGIDKETARKHLKK